MAETGEEGTEWFAYLHREYDFANFPPGSRVVDVGAGRGAELAELVSRGHQAVGTELDERYIAKCRARGLTMLKAVAEALPFGGGTLDGLVVKGVMPFTEEDQAFAEFARVLRPGGRVEALYLGAGYYLRYLLAGPGLKYRFYGLRALVSTIVHRLTGRALPGWLGDTIFQTRRGLSRHYGRHGFTVVRDTPSPRFLGLPVFIYHTLERRPGEPAPTS